MGSRDLLAVLGGLSLFLYGMYQMSASLGAVMGRRGRQLLKRLTANRVTGVLAGCAVTAVLQSSSATTVMVVGLVNTGALTLRQAVYVIMGANIGTTVTGQLTALSVGELAPFVVFMGILLLVCGKKDVLLRTGELLAALGVLFMGMELMCEALSSLGDAQGMAQLLTQAGNPLFGILSGTILAAAVQSSSAAVGILQALAESGSIPFFRAVYALFGVNIGTCVTAVLASVGMSRNARRAALVHLAFNTVGMLVFTVLCQVTPLAAWVERMTPGNPAAQIANMHTLLNLGTALLLLPVGGYLAEWAEWILPEDRKNTFFDINVRK